MTKLDKAHQAAGDEMRRLQGCSLRHAIRVGLEALGVDPDSLTIEDEQRRQALSSAGQVSAPGFDSVTYNRD